MAADSLATPDRILSELAHVWVTLGKQEGAETGMGVLRACSTNLIVVAEEADDFQTLGETIAALMPEHPARAILIHLGPAAGPSLSARVFAQCWMPFGQRRQICCEQIEITASENALNDAVGLASAVAASDLPIVLWCRSLRLIAGLSSGDLGTLATRVVADSAGAPDAKAALRSLLDTVRRGVRLGDLSWTRLTRWREMLSQLFENRGRLMGVPSLLDVDIRFGATRTPSVAWYMAAWLSESFRSIGVSVTYHLEAVDSTPEGELQRVTLRGPNFRVELTRTNGRLQIAADDVTHCVSLPAANDYSLMREELGILQPDLVFERTLQTAVSL